MNFKYNFFLFKQITGDNIMTALSVAKDCKMVKPHEEVYIVKCEGYGNDKPKLTVELSRDIGAVDDPSSNGIEDIQFNSVGIFNLQNQFNFIHI